MKLKPKPYSMGCCGYDILYKCAKCSFQFNLANEDWRFCPHCGQEIDWGVVVRANEEWKQLFLDTLEDEKAKQKLLDELDVVNRALKSNKRHAMQSTEATKKAILKSNLRYYLNEGWTKEQLIDAGFFTKEEINDASC